MIDEKKLVEEIESLQVVVTGLRACKGVLSEYAKHFKDSVIKTITEQPKVGEWISVEKELPKEKGYYLVTRKGHTCAEVRQFRGKKWAVDTQHFGEVIAWQPLPEPYKENEGD